MSNYSLGRDYSVDGGMVTQISYIDWFDPAATKVNQFFDQLSQAERRRRALEAQRGFLEIILPSNSSYHGDPDDRPSLRRYFTHFKNPRDSEDREEAQRHTRILEKAADILGEEASPLLAAFARAVKSLTRREYNSRAVEVKPWRAVLAEQRRQRSTFAPGATA